jgi:hypothetical protein
MSRWCELHFALVFFSQNRALLAVASGGTSVDVLAVASVKRDYRSMGTCLAPFDDVSISAEDIATMKELAIEACVSCSQRAVTLSADWLAERLRVCALACCCLCRLFSCDWYLCNRAFTTLSSIHASVVQALAWQLTVPSLRQAFISCFDALLTTQSRNADIVCSAATVVANAAELYGLHATSKVCGCNWRTEVGHHCLDHVFEPFFRVKRRWQPPSLTLPLLALPKSWTPPRLPSRFSVAPCCCGSLFLHPAGLACPSSCFLHRQLPSLRLALLCRQSRVPHFTKRCVLQ